MYSFYVFGWGSQGALSHESLTIPMIAMLRSLSPNLTILAKFLSLFLKLRRRPIKHEVWKRMNAHLTKPMRKKRTKKKSKEKLCCAAKLCCLLTIGVQEANERRLCKWPRSPLTFGMLSCMRGVSSGITSCTIIQSSTSHAGYAQCPLLCWTRTPVPPKQCTFDLKVCP